MNSIESLFKLSLKRKPKRLTYKSTYSHDNILDWLKDILPSWEICIQASLSWSLVNLII